MNKELIQIEVNGITGLWHRQLDDNHKSGLTLILLHGYGAGMRDLMGLTQYFDLYDEGLYLQGPGQTPFGGRSWFDIEYLPDGNLQFDEEQVLDSARLVDQSITDFIENYGLPDRKLILGGFSQGAGLSTLLGILAPRRYTGLLLMSGRIPEKTHHLIQDLNNFKQLSVFIGHGLQDQILPIRNGRNLKEFWDSLAPGVTYHEYPMGHEISILELQDISQWLNLFRNT